MKSILRQPSNSQKQAVVAVVVDKNEPVLISKKSSLNLTSTSIDSNDISTSNMNKISEQKAQRLKHFESLNTFEHQYNGGNLALMNSLQDNELNDILSNVNDYINLSLNKLNKYDDLISVSWVDINANQNTSWNKRSRKNAQDTNQFDDKLSTSSSSTTMNQNEFIMTITSINPVDFLQNSLRSGPFETAKLNAAEIEQQNKPSQTIAASSKPKIDTKTVIKLKYLLEIDLNTDYFDLNQVDEKGLVHSIRFKKKPQHWSIKDYDQISVDLSINKDEPFRKVIKSIINREKQVKNALSSKPTKIDYLKLSKPKSHRYLNSKALFDRLLKSFSSVLKYEWPYYHSSAYKENLLNELIENNKSDQAPSALSTTHTVKTNMSTHSNPNAVKYPICEDFKTCISNDNQLKISFKWKGVKHKDLDIIVLINVGVKYFNEQDTQTHIKINESLLEICNNFFENGGFFKPVNKLDLFQMEQICNWTLKYLKINLNSVYLVPTGVHHWSISLDFLKLNLIKFLIWTNSLNQSFIGIDTVVDLFNGTNNKNSSQMNAPKKFETKQPLYNFFSTIYLGKSSLHALLKSIQIFNSIFLSQIDEKSKLDDENLNYIDLILENILLELKLNVNNQKKSKITWSSEYTFDHFWSILMRLRYFILNSKLTDSFNFFDNLLPKVFYKYIGFHDLVLFNNYSQDGEISPRANFQHPLLIPFEIAMRISFTSIILDEIYLPGQAKFDQASEKDKTIFSKSNLINEILDYKSKHPEKSIKSSDTFGKVTVGTKNTKVSFNSKE